MTGGKNITLTRTSFHVLYFICIALCVVIEFGLNFVPYFAHVQPLLYFAQGTLFTLYGYDVLSDGTDLRKNIRHALKIFLVMLVLYGALTVGWLWLTTGNPFAGFTKRAIFNFVVLNVWCSTFCSSIWIVQSILYALIAFWILRKFKKYDFILCLVLFIISILLGEFAGLIRFKFLGYTYIPGNFFTRTMPYMLLGRLLCKHYKKITRRLHYHPMAYFCLGMILSIAEILALYYTGYLIYPNHFIGFIVMAASVCLWCVINPRGGFIGCRWKRALPTIYKGIYYVFNPLGYILLFAALIICKTEQVYIVIQYYIAVAVLILTIGVFRLVAFLKAKFESYDKAQEEYKR